MDHKAGYGQHEVSESAHAGMVVTACTACSQLEFHDSSGPVRAEVALARLFGTFDLVGGLDAVAAPGREVLMYRAPNRLQHAALRVFETHHWLRAGETIWVCQDGDHLLIAHNDPHASHLVGA